MSDENNGLIVPPSYGGPQDEVVEAKDDMQYGGGECDAPIEDAPPLVPGAVEEVRHVVSSDSGSAQETQGAPPEEQVEDHGYDFGGVNPPPNCRCVFTVVVGLDGHVMAYGNPETIPQEPVPMQGAELPDMWRACTEVAEDIHVTRIANTTAMTMMQGAQQMAQMQADAALAAQVGGAGMGVPIIGNRQQRRHPGQ